MSWVSTKNIPLEVKEPIFQQCGKCREYWSVLNEYKLCIECHNIEHLKFLTTKNTNIGIFKFIRLKTITSSDQVKDYTKCVECHRDIQNRHKLPVLCDDCYLSAIGKQLTYNYETKEIEKQIQTELDKIYKNKTDTRRIWKEG